jgi:hypothetical protein
MAFAFKPLPATGGLLCILLLFTTWPEASIPQQPPMMADQVNTDSWDGAWTNLVNDVRQSFKPALPRLEAVEVELVLGNPENAKDRLTLTVLDADGTVLSTVSKVVEAWKCDHVLFALSNGGLDVTPGQTYAVKLSGGTTFGLEVYRGWIR